MMVIKQILKTVMKIISSTLSKNCKNLHYLIPTLDIKSSKRGLRGLPNKMQIVYNLRILLINNKYYTLYVHRPQIQCLCGVSENQEILAFFSNFTFSKAQRTHVHIIYMSKFTYLACSRNVFF